MSYDDTLNAIMVAELAQEIEGPDSIDWGDLAISESAAYELVANQVYEYYKETEDMKGERLVFLATIVKLTVENFVLNLQLMKAANGKQPIK